MAASISKKVVIYVDQEQVVDIVMKHYGLSDKYDIWGTWSGECGNIPARLTIRYSEDEEVQDG